MLRLTWVQPEDLLGHELRQAALDGREPSRIAARWRAAGGSQALLRAGSSPEPASRYLRTLAKDLLDELADLPSRLKDDEPTDLEKIKSRCPDWPSGPRTSTAPPTPTRYEAAWLGRAVGCLLGKPVEKLPSKPSANWPHPPATGP